MALEKIFVRVSILPSMHSRSGTPNPTTGAMLCVRCGHVVVSIAWHSTAAANQCNAAVPHQERGRQWACRICDRHAGRAWLITQDVRSIVPSSRVGFGGGLGMHSTLVAESSCVLIQIRCTGKLSYVHADYSLPGMGDKSHACNYFTAFRVRICFEAIHLGPN